MITKEVLGHWRDAPDDALDADVLRLLDHIDELTRERDEDRKNLGGFIAKVDVALGGTGTAAPERVIAKVHEVLRHKFEQHTRSWKREMKALLAWHAEEVAGLKEQWSLATTSWKGRAEKAEAERDALKARVAQDDEVRALFDDGEESLVDRGAIEVALRRIKEAVAGRKKAEAERDALKAEVGELRTKLCSQPSGFTEAAEAERLRERNTELIQEMRPVADWFHAVADLIDERIEGVKHSEAYTRQASKATVPLHEMWQRVIVELHATRENIADLGGWTGEEPDTLEENKALRAKVERLTAAIHEAYRVHVDVECPSTPCTCLRFDIVRAALADVAGVK